MRRSQSNLSILKPKQSVGIDVTLDRLEKICKFLYSFAKGEKILAGLAISGASKPEISEKISSDLKVTIFHFLCKQWTLPYTIDEFFERKL